MVETLTIKKQKNADLLEISTLIDSIWFIGIDLDKLERSAEKGFIFKHNLAELVQNLCNKSIIDRSLLLERLDENTLSDCNLIEQGSFKRKSKRLMTKNLFEQQKFNLFREESEGYTKLLVELLLVRDKDSKEILEKNVFSLIGYFDLDPNRVIDIILEALVFNSNSDMLLNLLKKFRRDY